MRKVHTNCKLFSFKGIFLFVLNSISVSIKKIL